MECMQGAVSVTQVDAVRSLHVFAFGALAALPLRLPDLQRPGDADRVAEIAAYQAGRRCMVGSLTVALNADGAWLVDGQHRWLAVHRLASQDLGGGVMWDTRAVVEAVDLRAPGAPSMAELFELVNRAVPVPDYIVLGTLDSYRRAALDEFGRMFAARFGAFVSAARNPRRPNVNLGALTDRVAASRELLARMPDAATLFRYVLHANAALGARDAAFAARADEKACKHGCEALYLAADPDGAWSEDAAEMDAFALLPGAAVDPAQRAMPMQMQRRRGPLPAALRVAAWNAAFGERAGEGRCACCGRAITQQGFECGHVISRHSGGLDTLDNLRPLCTTCNRSMGARNMDEFREAHFGSN